MEPLDFMAIHALRWRDDLEHSDGNEEPSDDDGLASSGPSSVGTPSIVSSDTEEEPDNEPEEKISTAKQNAFCFTAVSSNLNKHVISTEDKRLFARNMKSRKHHYCAMQEAMCPNTCEIVEGILFWSGPRIGKEGSEMCMCSAIDVSKFRRIAHNKKLSTNRLQVTEVRFHGTLFALVNGHRPCKGSTCGTFAKFDADLAVVKDMYPTNCIILGDFNAQPSRAMAGRLGQVSECFEPFLKTAVAADATLEAMVKPFRLMNFAQPEAPADEHPHNLKRRKLSSATTQDCKSCTRSTWRRRRDRTSSTPTPTRKSDEPNESWLDKGLPHRPAPERKNNVGTSKDSSST